MVKAFYGIDLGAVVQPKRRPGQMPLKATTRMRLRMARMTVRRLEKQLAREDARAKVPAISGRSGQARLRIGRHAGANELLLRLQPGAWYALCDLIVLMPEYKRASISFWLKCIYKGRLGLIDRGLVDRTENPAWEGLRMQGKKAGKGRYLYRLSSKGEEWRVGLLAEIEVAGVV